MLFVGAARPDTVEDPLQIDVPANTASSSTQQSKGQVTPPMEAQEEPSDSSSVTGSLQPASPQHVSGDHMRKTTPKACTCHITTTLAGCIFAATSVHFGMLSCCTIRACKEILADQQSYVVAELLVA